MGQFAALKQKYNILQTENAEYQQQIGTLVHQNEALMREVATYKMEEDNYYIPAMSMGFSSNRTCSTVNGVGYDQQIKVFQSDNIGLKEMNQKLRNSHQNLQDKYDEMMIANNEKVQALQNELDSIKNGIFYKASMHLDNEYLSSDSLSTLQDNYEDRLRELELENTKLLKRLDMVRNEECGLNGIEYINGLAFEEIALGDIADEFEENELEEMENLFRNCEAEIAENKMEKMGKHWTGRNMFRFLRYTPYKYWTYFFF